MKNELKKMAKFSSVGFIGTCTHAIVFCIAYELFNIDSVISNFIAFSIAICFSYMGHSNFTFPDQIGDAKLGWPVRFKFFQATFLGFLLNSAWAYFFIDKWHWSLSTYLIALFTLTPALAYFLNRHWVFKFE